MRRLLFPLTLAALITCGTTTAPTAAAPQLVPAPRFVEQESPPAYRVVSTRPLHLQPRPAATFRLWKFEAPVVRLHLTGSELVPPPDPSVLGWWGRRVGARHGTTLLTGHTVHTGGGELDDLELTPVGSVARVSGVRYRVTSVRVITKRAVARRSTHLFRQTGTPKLVVVTCEGYSWATGHYRDNVVVTAIPI